MDLYEECVSLFGRHPGAVDTAESGVACMTLDLGGELFVLAANRGRYELYSWGIPSGVIIGPGNVYSGEEAIVHRAGEILASAVPVVA